MIRRTVFPVAIAAETALSILHTGEREAFAEARLDALLRGVGLTLHQIAVQIESACVLETAQIASRAKLRSLKNQREDRRPSPRARRSAGADFLPHLLGWLHELRVGDTRLSSER